MTVLQTCDAGACDAVSCAAARAPQQAFCAAGQLVVARVRAVAGFWGVDLVAMGN